jgi:hypothetical protein
MTDMEEIQRNPMESGFYSLGYFQNKYPEIEWIFCVTKYKISKEDIVSLRSRIDNGLENNKTIALVIEDEAVIFPVNPDLVKLLNSYQNESFWLITRLDSTCQLIYTFQHGMKCKIIELPWIWLNDALVYYQVHSAVQPTNTTGSPSYICMIGKTIGAHHKLDLVRELQKQNLDQYGLITFYRPLEEFKNNKYIQVNPVQPYKNLNTKYSQAAAQVLCKTNLTQEDIWISGNVENFLHIEKTYSHIPLVVHPETTVGIFDNTEKSLWPLLLGKMTLIYSRPGQMASIQRFYDFDISKYADLSFDVCDGYNDQAHYSRLQMMLSDNQDLVKNSKDIYTQFRVDLETARWSIGQNLLDFCHAQIDIILNKEKQINDLSS